MNRHKKGIDENGASALVQIVTLRLANALTALYPRGSQEKRLLDAMLLAVPR